MTPIAGDRLAGIVQHDGQNLAEMLGVQGRSREVRRQLDAEPNIGPQGGSQTCFFLASTAAKVQDRLVDV